MPSMSKHVVVFLVWATLNLFAAFTPPATGQTSPQTAQPLEFEVATIKPVDPKGMVMVGTDVSPGGTVKLSGLSLKALIQVAFNVSYWQIQGGEGWMENTRYNVVGEPPDTVRQTIPNTRHTLYSIADPRLREMLQSLLIQRFQLKIHRATQPGKVYFLERTSKPLPLKPIQADPAGSPPSPYPSGDIGWVGGRWSLHDTTMLELADFAGSYMLHRPVLDRTELTGAFDYRSALEDTETPTTNSVSSFQERMKSSFLELLQEVGLKLTPAQGEAKILTIDHAEPPSDN